MTDIEKKFGSIENAVKEAIKFHGKCKYTPGIIIGVYMLDFGLKKFYEEFKEKEGNPVRFNVVCETDWCLPDVFQILMHLTLGNRYMHIVKADGKFAYALYDRKDGNGVRVFINLEKLNKDGEIYKFFTRTRDNIVHTDAKIRSLSNRKIFYEYMDIADKFEIFGYKKVHVNIPAKVEYLPAKICKICGESFLSKDKEICLTCSGEKKAYFTYL